MNEVRSIASKTQIFGTADLSGEISWILIFGPYKVEPVVNLSCLRPHMLLRIELSVVPAVNSPSAENGIGALLIYVLPPACYAIVFSMF